MIKRTTYKRVKRVTLHRIIKPHQGTQKCTKEAETQHSTERCTYKNYETCKLHGEGDIRSTWHRDVRRSVEADRNGRLGQVCKAPSGSVIPWEDSQNSGVLGTITVSPRGKVIKGKGAQGRVWARPGESKLPAALSQGSAVDSPALTVPAAACDNTHKVFPTRAARRALVSRVCPGGCSHGHVTPAQLT